MITSEKVFEYFKQISAIPRGSGNMQKIADYCVEFAKKNSLKYIRDGKDNVVIFKDASINSESNEPIILQGHLDIVCQKDETNKIDFLNDGIEVIEDGDFLRANGTTLGGDNGIAIAMILSILESNEITHPPIEAVFTTDEETGMYGAIALDTSVLRAKKMINLDSEEEDVITVSCAGGRECIIKIPLERKTINSSMINIELKGLMGGHSGVEIDKGRINANILAGRFLNHLNSKTDFHILSINGGNKSNAITNNCKISICTKNSDMFIKLADEYLSVIKNEIKEREPNFYWEISEEGSGEYNILSDDLKKNIIYTLLCIPNGVMQMSAEINGLVETSLNLGILETDNDFITINTSIRSNKTSAMDYIEEKIKTFFNILNCSIEVKGHYPPWEYNSNSTIRELYKECFIKQFGYEPKTEAIHAGLECGIFSSKIKGIDCIAVGPNLYDVHTTSEKLSISSTKRIYNLLINVLEKS